VTNTSYECLLVVLEDFPREQITRMSSVVYLYHIISTVNVDIAYSHATIMYIGSKSCASHRLIKEDNTLHTYLNKLNKTIRYNIFPFAVIYAHVSRCDYIAQY